MVVNCVNPRNIHGDCCASCPQGNIRVSQVNPGSPRPNRGKLSTCVGCLCGCLLRYTCSARKHTTSPAMSLQRRCNVMTSLQCCSDVVRQTLVSTTSLQRSCNVMTLLRRCNDVVGQTLVSTTSLQHRCNVMTLHRSCNEVVATLCVCLALECVILSSLQTVVFAESWIQMGRLIRVYTVYYSALNVCWHTYCNNGHAKIQRWNSPTQKLRVERDKNYEDLLSSFVIIT